LAILALLGFASPQQINPIVDTIIPPKNMADTITEAFKPVTDMMEPFKTYSGERERGVPIVHEELGKYH